jgi:hypothetical protein
MSRSCLSRSEHLQVQRREQCRSCTSNNRGLEHAKKKALQGYPLFNSGINFSTQTSMSLLLRFLYEYITWLLLYSSYVGHSPKNSARIPRALLQCSEGNQALSGRGKTHMLVPYRASLAVCCRARPMLACLYAAPRQTGILPCCPSIPAAKRIRPASGPVSVGRRGGPSPKAPWGRLSSARSYPLTDYSPITSRKEKLLQLVAKPRSPFPFDLRK